MHVSLKTGVTLPNVGASHPSLYRSSMGPNCGIGLILEFARCRAGLRLRALKTSQTGPGDLRLNRYESRRMIAPRLEVKIGDSDLRPPGVPALVFGARMGLH
jgi:hypothetical protein